jgi:molybdenum cofactor cytidylyltransferase
MMKLELAPLVVAVRPDDTLNWLPPGAGYTLAVCEEADLGISYSIRAALRCVREMSANAEGVLISLADHPFVTAPMLDRWLSAFRNDPSLRYVAGASGGVPMPPVLWSRAAFPSLETLEGDAGGRQLIASGRWKGMLLPLDRIASMDVDTPVDLQSVRTIWSTRAQMG